MLQWRVSTREPVTTGSDDTPPVDEREQEADERERLLLAREAKADEKDAARAADRDRRQNIVAAAEARDEKADDRDTRADERDGDADREAFLSSSHYGDDLPARRHAAMDRSHSRDDRLSAAKDRSDLTGEPPGETQTDGEADTT